ncbi:MAG: hypothetical protein M3115_05530, partial [Thermoproteota archaeon]|nr:hypothetical protein [Thermoproteota archaeon]
ASNAKMLSILHQFPCLLKCVHDIRVSEYSDIDPLYLQKHDYVKKRLIDAIVRRFSNKLAISSEEKIDNGTIDICVYSDKIICINKEKKKVGIEVKSGRSIDLFQIERYLCQLDVLIVVRVPTQEVTKISQKDITQELIDNNFATVQKIRQIKEQGLIKVKGEWCTGCTALCQHRRTGHITKSNPTLRDYPEFIKNVNIVTEKVIQQLELEFVMD